MMVVGRFVQTQFAGNSIKLKYRPLTSTHDGQHDIKLSAISAISKQAAGGNAEENKGKQRQILEIKESNINKTKKKKPYTK